jgi:MoaD family protein
VVAGASPLPPAEAAPLVTCHPSPVTPLTVRIQFWSYFKDLTGCTQASEELPAGATIGDLMRRLHARFPKLVVMEKSTLIAVGVEYQGRDYILKDGDEVSLFPPVQGG